MLNLLGDSLGGQTLVLYLDMDGSTSGQFTRKFVHSIAEIKLIFITYVIK